MMLVEPGSCTYTPLQEYTMGSSQARVSVTRNTLKRLDSIPRSRSGANREASGEYRPDGGPDCRKRKAVNDAVMCHLQK